MTRTGTSVKTTRRTVSEAGPSSQALKLPLRRLEFALKQLIDEAIPAHLNDLQKHQKLISQIQRSKQWILLQKEQVKASRTVKMLQNDVHELEKLRSRVEEDDIKRFEERIKPIQNRVRLAVKEFLVCHPLPVEELSLPDDGHDETRQPVTQQIQEQILEDNLRIEAENRESLSVLQSAENLRRDLIDLNEITKHIAVLVHQQGEKIDTIENNVSHASDNVVHGTQQLRKAAAYKMAMLPVTGAIFGTALGGPIGLLAGYKVAGIASALGLGALGYMGGKAVQHKRLGPEKMIDYKKSDGDEAQPSISRNNIPSQQVSR